MMHGAVYPSLYSETRKESAQVADSYPTKPKPKVGLNYGLWLAKLQNDKKNLSQIKSRSRRAQLKADLLPEYADYLSAAINSSDGSHDEVVVMWAVWALDCGNREKAMLLAEIALKRGMNAPTGFKRNLAETLLEEAAQRVELDPNPHYWQEVLQALDDLTQLADVKDEIHAKFYKAQGLALQSTNPQAALQAYHKAKQHGAKVARLIKHMNKVLNIASTF
jgi:hypothetical protein